MLPPIIRPCPHCGGDHDINARINGDVVLCHFCGKWFRFVIRLNGSAYLAKCEPPPGTEPAQATTADAALLVEMSVLRAELETAKAELLLLRELREDVERWREGGGDARDVGYILDTLDKLEESFPHQDSA